MLATNNTYGYSEYAEEFYSKENVKIHGVFVSSPAVNNIDGMQIQIRVYSGEKGPESLITSYLTIIVIGITVVGF